MFNMINQRQLLGRLIFLALGCMMAGSCSDNEPTGSREKGNKEAVTFSTYADYATDTALVNDYLIRARLLLRDTNIDLAVRSDSAMTLARAAAGLSDRIGYYEGSVNAVVGIYAINFLLDRFSINKDSLFLGIAACNKIKDDKLRAYNLTILYNILASFYSKASNYDSSFFFYVKAIALAESQGKPDTPTLIMLCNNAGVASTSSGYSADKGIAYYKKGLDMAHAIKDTHQFGTLYHNMGEYFQKTKKQYDTAMVYFNQALRYYRKEGSGRDMQLVYFTMAFNSMDQGDVRQAGYYIDSARKSFKNKTISETDYTYQLVMGEYLFLQGKYKQAASFFERSLRLSKHNGNASRAVDNYIYLAKCYDSTGNYKKASYYKTLAYDGQQDIMNTTIARTIASVQARYDLAQKDKVIAENKVILLQQQNSLQQQYLLTGAIGLSALLLIGTLSLLLFRKQQKVKMEQLKGVLAGEEQERKRLAQELHDGIVSQLSAIRMNLSALSAQHEVIRNTSGYTEALSQLEEGITELRNTSHNLMPGIMEQIGLVAAVQSFCSSLGQSSGVAIEFLQIGELPALPAAHELHIYRILQELIFNIIKHANATNILVQFRTADQRFQVTIDDNSTVQDTVQQEKLHAGIGQYNIRNRLEVLGGKIEIEHAPAGTSVYLEFDGNRK